MRLRRRDERQHHSVLAFQRFQRYKATHFQHTSNVLLHFCCKDECDRQLDIRAVQGVHRLCVTHDWEQPGGWIVCCPCACNTHTRVCIVFNLPSYFITLFRSFKLKSMVLGVAINSAVDVELDALNAYGTTYHKIASDFSGVYTRSFGEWSSGHSSKTERDILIT